MSFAYLPFEENSASLIAGFTLKNPSYQVESATIQGLNIGLNQLEKHEIVFENRRLFFNSVRIADNKVSSAGQIHSNTIAFVEEAGFVVPEVDGLITNKKGICLLIQVADCAPILLSDQTNGIIAVVHAGWRGAATGILINMIHKMIDLGANTKYIKMAVGPCIGVDNFEVGPEVVNVFPKVFSKKKENGKYLLNLKMFLKNQALDKGLLIDNIQISSLCSVSEDAKCYSHRREGSLAGRMGGFIYLTP